MLYIALVTVYVIICFFLILVVLLQQGQGRGHRRRVRRRRRARPPSAPRGATTFLHKLTTFAFIGFVLISMLLSIIEARPKASVIDKALPAAAAPQKPAVPARGARSRRRRAGAAQPAPNAARPPRAVRRSLVVSSIGPRAVVVELVDTYV